MRTGLVVGATGLEPAILSDPNRALYQAELRPEVLFKPFKLFHGFPSMTVRTPNLAFIDFLRKPSPSYALTNHVANIRSLFAANMIELEHPGIALTTVDARVER